MLVPVFLVFSEVVSTPSISASVSINMTQYIAVWLLLIATDRLTGASKRLEDRFRELQRGGRTVVELGECVDRAVWCLTRFVCLDKTKCYDLSAWLVFAPDFSLVRKKKHL